MIAVKSTLITGGLACLLVGCAIAQSHRSFPEPATLASRSSLPDPLVMSDGRPVASPAQWVGERRPELKALFQHYMYGPIPPKPAREKMTVVAEYKDFLGGSATLKLVTIQAGPDPAAEAGGRWPNHSAWGREWSNDSTGTPGLAYGSESTGPDLAPYGSAAPASPHIDLMLVIPNQSASESASPADGGRLGKAGSSHSKPAVFLAMNFCGNHALTPDARVPLARSWLADSCKGCTNNAATDAARGVQAADWPLAEMVRRGYALAAFYSGDIDSDRKEISDGLYAWLAKGEPARNNPTNRGTIAAWAWGFERCVDYLVTDPDIDPARIAAVGHSRNGKTALLAAAFDERIAMALPHQAGCGGTAPSRGNTGESVKAINDHFPHWFNAEFKKFNDTPDRLPFDQNCLVALCAPRPVLISAARGDRWSNPSGQFEVLQGAAPVYRFLGVECDVPASPSADAPSIESGFSGSRLGWYLREGNHSMTAGDWRVFMDFADKQWRPGANGASGKP